MRTALFVDVMGRKRGSARPLPPLQWGQTNGEAELSKIMFVLADAPERLLTPDGEAALSYLANTVGAIADNDTDFESACILLAGLGGSLNQKQWVRVRARAARQHTVWLCERGCADFKAVQDKVCAVGYKETAIQAQKVLDGDPETALRSLLAPAFFKHLSARSNVPLISVLTSDHWWRLLLDAAAAPPFSSSHTFGLRLAEAVYAHEQAL